MTPRYKYYFANFNLNKNPLALCNGMGNGHLLKPPAE